MTSNPSRMSDCSIVLDPKNPSGDLPPPPSHAPTLLQGPKECVHTGPFVGNQLPKNRFCNQSIGCIDKKQSCQSVRPALGCVGALSLDAYSDPMTLQDVQKIRPGHKVWSLHHHKAPSTPTPKSPTKIMNHEKNDKVWHLISPSLFNPSRMILVGHKQSMLKRLVNISNFFFFKSHPKLVWQNFISKLSSQLPKKVNISEYLQIS